MTIKTPNHTRHKLWEVGDNVIALWDTDGEWRVHVAGDTSPVSAALSPDQIPAVIQALQEAQAFIEGTQDE